MKKLSVTLTALMIGMFLVGCNSGSSNTPSDGFTQYNLQNYKFEATSSNNCSVTGSSTLSCDSTGTFGSVVSVTYNTPNLVPGAYLVLPTSESGVNFSPTGNGCPQTAPDSGATYTCNFTIASNGTAQAGAQIVLNITGSLGDAELITINLN